MNKTLLTAMMALSVIGMTSVAYAASSFQIPESTGSDSWFVKGTEYFTENGAEKIDFVYDGFIPSEGKVDTISFISPDQRTQKTKFGIEGAYLDIYQNNVQAVLNGKTIQWAYSFDDGKLILPQPGQIYSIEFDGDQVKFYWLGNVFAEGTLNDAGSEKEPFLSCTTKGLCGSNLAKTVNRGF